jgi:hypothetical protein
LGVRGPVGVEFGRGGEKEAGKAGEEREQSVGSTPRRLQKAGTFWEEERGERKERTTNLHVVP